MVFNMASSKSLSEQLSQIINPVPEGFDQDEDIDTETSARVTETFNEGDDDITTRSKLRAVTSALLDDEDERYAGKTTSRKSLIQDEENSRSDDDDLSALKAFRSEFKEAQNKAASDSSYSDADDGMETDDQSEGEHAHHEEDSGLEDEESTYDHNDNETEEDSSEEVVKNFSQVDIGDQVEKGKATKAQLCLWDSLLEIRIKLQKILQLSNRFPQYDTWPSFMQAGDTDFKKVHEDALKTLGQLVNNFLQLQTLVLLQNSETMQMAGEDAVGANVSDEEIDSESENERITRLVNVRKRKLQPSAYPGFLEKRHKIFETYRNATIQKWNERTRLASGKIARKSFSAFEQSALRQIEQILSDKQRLIHRTQLRRTVYPILGKDEAKLSTQDNTADKNEPKESQKDDNYDVEIFDDDDFYHQLLRELIEKKTVSVDDPVALGRKWLEIQKLRSKIKRKVDTKASKGRRIRYDLHSKLINFMAPFDKSKTSDEARNELFSSLFGKRLETSMDN